MRTHGSCRFEPYYKVQTWNAVALAWEDVQRSYTTQVLAEADFPSSGRARVMEVTMAGRRPVPDSERTKAKWLKPLRRAIP